jgi:general secretion pathway protein F
LNTYNVIARSSAGLLQSVQVAAADASVAASQVGKDGWQVLSCEPSKVRRAGVRPAGGGRRRRKALDVASFAHELASLLSAGLSVMQALQTLAAAGEGSGDGGELAEVARIVSEGQTLSAAMERHAERFPALLVATIRASEQTGNLSQALLRYSEHQQRLKALRDKVTGAAIYPLLLLALGGLVVLFLLGVVVPRFATLIESTRQELPWTSRLLMAWGGLVAHHASLMAAASLAFIVGAVAGVRHLIATGGRARWVETLPLIGPMIREFRHAQLYRTTGMLVHGGIPLPKALALSESLLGDDDRARLQRTIALIREGRSLSDALDVTEMADAVTRGMLSVAERTGALSEILDRIAQFKESRLQRSVDWAGRLIEPALMVVIGLVIGAIVVMMYLPIFDLASSLQ